MRDSAPWLNHSITLAYGLVNWLTKGTFVGEHHTWFSAQVEDAMIEADDPATVFVSHEDAKRSWANRKAELQALAGQGQGTER